MSAIDKESASPYERYLSPEDSAALSAYVSFMEPPAFVPARPTLQNLPSELKDQIDERTLLEEEQQVTLHRAPRREEREDSVVGEVGDHVRDEEVEVDRGPPPTDLMPSGLEAGLKYRADPDYMKSMAGTTMLEEYLRTEQRCMTLVVRDSDKFDFHNVVVPDAIQSVRWLVCYNILFCHSCACLTHENEQKCRAVAELSRHQQWLEDLLEQLPRLRACATFVHLSHDDCVPGQTTPLPCEALLDRKLQEWKKVPKLKELKMFRYQYPGHFDGPKDLVLDWKPPLGNRVERVAFPDS